MTELSPSEPPVRPINPLQQVITWLVEGQAEGDIRDSIARQWPDENAEPLLIAAVKQLQRDGNPDLDMLYGFALEATRMIYQKSVEVGDHQTALRAIKQLVDLAQK